MSRSLRCLLGMSALVVAVGLAGCGATRSSPDNPLTAGGLTPRVEDREAGLVAMAPGFDVKAHRTIAVALFPVTDKLEDEGDRAFAATMAGFFRAELVRRLRDSGLSDRVVEADAKSYRPGPGERALMLDGAITRLGRGAQAARVFAGIYGAGRARAQADMRFVDASSGKVVLVTADRRVASIGPLGGSDERLLREAFDDMARDLARFLVRLSRGEAPRKD